MAASMEEGFDLMYPDLLSREGLLFTLRKRYVHIQHTDLDSLDKESLVDLYNQYILPMPQRKYRDNLRGQEMRKSQMLTDKKRKFSMADDGDSISFNKKRGRLSQEGQIGPSRGLVNHFKSTNSSENRLKPPPSCIDSGKKVVKLSSTSPTKTEGIKCSGDDKSNGAVKRPVTEGSEDSSSPKKKINKIAWP